MSRFARTIAYISLLTVLLPLAAFGADPVVKVRFSTSPETVRIVLDLPQETVYMDRSTPQQIQVSLPLPLAEALPAVTVDDPIAPSITIAPDADGNTQLTVPLVKARKYAMFTLKPSQGKPYRLVIDVFKRFRKVETRALSPAITYSRIEQQTDEDYLLMHVVEADLTDPKVRVGVTPAQGERERVNVMVTRAGAVCGVNGGYFINGTRPVGLLKFGGQVMSLPLWGRTAVAFPRVGKPVFGNPKGVWRVSLPDGTERDMPDWLDASILEPAPNAVVYSGMLFTQVPANPGGLTVLIRDGKVIARSSEMTPLQAGDLALRLRGEDATVLDTQLALESPVKITPVLEPTWQEYLDAIGAGPRLLRDAQIAITGQEERFKPDVLTGRRARTGLGLTAKGVLVLLVVEEKGPYGGGATLDELAALLKSRSAVDALNLDGGGSSALAIGADIVNYPSGSWVRPVVSSVLVFDERIPAAPNTIAAKQ